MNEIKDNANSIGDEKEKKTTSIKVGAMLKNNRTKADKKIEQVAEELKIRKCYLTAIEASDYDNIPEFPYGIGFIRSYARFFDLDDNDIVEKFKEEIGASDIKTPTFQTNENEEEFNLPSKKNIYISILALIGISLIWIFSTFDSKKTEMTIKEYSESSIEASEEESRNKAEDQAIIITEESYAPTEELEVDKQTFIEEEPKVDDVAKIKVFDETWIEVKTDSKLFISKVLNADEEYILPKEKGLKLSIGKINGADLFIGEKRMNVLNNNKKINIELDTFLKEAQ